MGDPAPPERGSSARGERGRASGIVPRIPGGMGMPQLWASSHGVSVYPRTVPASEQDPEGNGSVTPNRLGIPPWAPVLDV